MSVFVNLIDEENKKYEIICGQKFMLLSDIVFLRDDKNKVFIVRYIK